VPQGVTGYHPVWTMRGAGALPRILASMHPPDLCALVDRASDVIFRYRVLPPEGFDFVSRGVTRLTGYTPEEHYANPELVRRLVHPDDRPLIEDLLSSGATARPIVLRWLSKDGRSVWVEQRDTSVYDERGELAAIEGVARAVHDPTKGARPTIRIAGDVRIDLDRDRVFVDGKAVRLTRSEFRLLVMLTDQPGETVSRRRIMEELGDGPCAASGRTCEVHVSKLRAKIENGDRRVERIETVRGQGYRYARP
jgi:PAS domain S-box-containing protein